MKTHMVITTQRGRTYESEALHNVDPTDIDKVRQLLADLDVKGWFSITTGGKVAYVRASTIESIELWEGDN